MEESKEYMEDNAMLEAIPEKEKESSLVTNSGITSTGALAVQPLPGLFRAEERSLSFTSNTLTALSKARTVGIIDPITGALTIDGVTISTSIGGIGESKLLLYALSAFTKQNPQNAKTFNLRTYGDTKDFARACGVKIDPQPMATPEEQKKENRKASKALINFVSKLGKNAETLLKKAAFSWDEEIKGQSTAFRGISFIGAYSIDSDVIMIEFTQSAAEYIVQLALSETPRALYAVDDRRPNAYAIAQALVTHYGMNNNVIKNTERILQVKTILRYTTFPDQETIKAKRWSWERVVKEPFEEALDELTRTGLISNWRYCLSKMGELTDEQAANILRYEQFSSLYLYFELSGYDSHTDRYKQISAKKEAEKKKASKKKRKQEDTPDA